MGHQTPHHSLPLTPAMNCFVLSLSELVLLQCRHLDGRWVSCSQREHEPCAPPVFPRTDYLTRSALYEDTYLENKMKQKTTRRKDINDLCDNIDLPLQITQCGDKSKRLAYSVLSSRFRRMNVGSKINSSVMFSVAGVSWSVSVSTEKLKSLRPVDARAVLS